MIKVKAVYDGKTYSPAEDLREIKDMTSMVFNGTEYLCYQGDEPIVEAPKEDEPQPE